MMQGGIAGAIACVDFGSLVEQQGNNLLAIIFGGDGDGEAVLFIGRLISAPRSSSSLTDAG